MSPQTDQNSTQSEQAPVESSSNSTGQADFDFMLKQPQAQKSSSRLSSFGKPVKILIAAVVALIIAVVAAVIFGGGETNSQQVLDLMAQGQEIVRISQAQEQNMRDQGTKDLAATTQAIMNSQKFELGDYLSRSNVKYDPKVLAVKMNQETDTQLQTAAQNNNLDAAYVLYLKTSLTTYLNSLDSTFKSTASQNLKSTLQSAYASTQTLLQSPQFSS